MATASTNPDEKQMEDQMLYPIQLAERVQFAVNEAESFHAECWEVGQQVDRLTPMLHAVVRFATTTPFLYEPPIRRIFGEICKNLVSALTLVKKCKRQSVLQRVVSITSATDFRRLSSLLDCSLDDMKWLLSIFDLDSAGTGIVLSLPPIASNDPILALIWSTFATIQMSQLPADRVKAAVLLLLDTDTIRAILNEGGVPIIAQILRDSAVEVQTRAASLVAKMVHHDSVAGFEFASENVTRPLVTLLSFDSFVEESMIQLEPVASASAPFQWEYDVFLNFVGMDCPNLIPLLQGELQESKHSKILMCDVSFGELRDIASPSASLPRKIKASRLAIIVLSPRYTSAFCMELLIMILHCVEDKSRILPIYYDMDPSDLQWGSYASAFLA